MKLIITFILMLLSGDILAENYSTANLLLKYFPKYIEVKAANEIWLTDAGGVVDIYRSNGRTDELADYLYILFYKKGAVTLLENFGSEIKFKDRAMEYQGILNRMSKYCKKNTISADCILDGMAGSLEIHKCIGRYDEGQFCYSCDHKKTVCKKL